MSPVEFAYGSEINNVFEQELSKIKNPSFGDHYLALAKALEPSLSDKKPVDIRCMTFIPAD